MKNRSISLHRVIKASPEKVFSAFSNPVAHAAWLPPYGFICTVKHMVFKVGGMFHMTFINFGTGHEHAFGGTYLEIRPNAFIKYSDTFDDPNLPEEMITTIQLNQVSCGTELKVVQEGISSMIPLEMCYLGWQESLDKLIKLVEPNIPDV